MEEAKLTEPRGLKPEHESELNRGVGIATERYNELRKMYSGDPLAQMVIDVYDPMSDLYRLTVELRDAAKAASRSGDRSEEEKLFRRVAQFKKERYGIDSVDG